MHLINYILNLSKVIYNYVDIKQNHVKFLVLLKGLITFISKWREGTPSEAVEG